MDSKVIMDAVKMACMTHDAVDNRSIPCSVLVQPEEGEVIDQAKVIHNLPLGVKVESIEKGGSEEKPEYTLNLLVTMTASAYEDIVDRSNVFKMKVLKNDGDILSSVAPKAKRDGSVSFTVKLDRVMGASSVSYFDLGMQNLDSEIKELGLAKAFAKNYQMRNPQFNTVVYSYETMAKGVTVSLQAVGEKVLLRNW